MATRRETQSKREQLRESLLNSCRDGSLSPGDILPPLHQLARQYALSVTSASQVIKQLVDDGVLQTTQGAGTFVGHALEGSSGLYLLVLPDGFRNNTKQVVPMKLGFEERVTQVGGTCLTLGASQVQQFLQQEQRLELQGIFNFAGESESSAVLDQLYVAVPQVRFGEAAGLGAAEPPTDCVAFDDEGAGYLATRHLQTMRHQRISFLGLHGALDTGPLFAWSRQRQYGWARALAERGLGTTGLAFTPERSALLHIGQQEQVAFAVAKQMIAPLLRGQIAGVVAVNCHATRGLFQALHQAHLPHHNWPAVICFGEAESTGGAPAVVSELRMPWEILGREAADLLWQRRSYQGPPRRLLVPMRLISRLSCRANWQLLPQAVSLALQPA